MASHVIIFFNQRVDFFHRKDRNRAKPQAFAKSGIDWTSGAVGKAERKAAQRELEEVIGNNLARGFRPNKTKTLAVKLTEAGEALARALCGLPTMADSLDMLCDLAERSKRHPTYLQEKWIGEDEITGVPWGGQTRDYLHLEELFLPALGAEYMISNSNGLGHVRYAVTAAGWKFLDTHDDEANADQEPREACDEEARTLYYQKIKEALTRLETSLPANTREIGFLPLPVALWNDPA